MTTAALADIDPRNGLTMDVLRHADGHDYTNGGFSSTVTELTVVGVIREVTRRAPVCEPLPPAARVFRPNPSRPAALLWERDVFGRTVWAIVPALHATATSAALRGHLSTLMMGSNFAHASDSRISEITRLYGAIAIHDRTERPRD